MQRGSMWAWPTGRYNKSEPSQTKLLGTLAVISCAGLLYDPFHLVLQIKMLASHVFFTILLGQRVVISASAAAPPGFPESGNGLWYKSPGAMWSKEWLPIGNGYLAGTPCYYLVLMAIIFTSGEAMVPGGTIYEQSQLNIESLWYGGPFQNSVRKQIYYPRLYA
jgi:hypothetical protein